MRPNYYRRRLTPNFGISWKVFRRLFLVGVAVFLAFKIVGCVQENIAWREATRLTRLATEDFNEDNRELVRSNLNIALSLSPRHVDASRLAARLADLEGDSRAIGYYETVLESSSAGVDDWRRAAISASRYKRFDLALKWAERAAKLGKDPSFPHQVRALIYAAQGDAFEQERELRAAVAAKESPETLNALATFLLNSTDQLSIRGAEAATLLRKISVLDSGPSGLDALKQGLSSGILEQGEVREWLDAYRAHPACNPVYALFVDEIQMQLFPDTRAAVLAGVVQRGQALAPASRVALARWLMKNNDPASVLALLPLQDALQDPSAFQSWVDASISLKMLKEASEALSNSSNPLPPHQTQAMQAAIFGLMGDSARSQQLWMQVLASNRGRPASFLELLVSLIRAGEWKLLFQEMPVLLNDPAWALKTVETLIPVVRQHRDSTLMLEFYKQSMKTRFLAKEALPADRAAYTRLVLGEIPPLGELELRAKKYPEIPGFRTTYALGLFRSGSKVKALFELKGVEPPISPDHLLPHQKAIYSAILAANGETEEARALVKTIPPASLTRQEEALFLAPLESKNAN